MAESTLSISYTDLQKEVGHFLGYKGESATWGADKVAEVDRYIQSGVRRFYYPPAMEGVEAGYEWSFMRPTATIETVAAGEAQDLPDDFGRIIGDLFCTPDVSRNSIVVVGEGRMLSLWQRGDPAGLPRYAAVRHKESDGATGQRLQVMWWPVPSDAFTITYRYESYAGKLTTAKPYPLGGMRHSELILESCLAVAEQRANDELGLHGERFGALLAAGIAQDRRNGPRHYGHLGKGTVPALSSDRFGVSTYPVTYKGETW